MESILQILMHIWNFILGSIRIILFLSCTLVVLAQVGWLLYVISTLNTYGKSIPESDWNYNIVIHSVVILVLGAFGCWASFFNHRPSLKVLALLTAIATIALIVIVANNVSDKEEAKGRDAYKKFMTEQAKHYNWKGDGKAEDEASKTATKLWDTLQSEGTCCGLNDEKFWDNYRPKEVSDTTAYPKSCCSPDRVDNTTGLCKRGQGLTEFGCWIKIDLMQSVLRISYGIFIIAIFVLTLLSSIYIFGSSGEETTTNGQVYRM